MKKEKITKRALSDNPIRVGDKVLYRAEGQRDVWVVVGYYFNFGDEKYHFACRDASGRCYSYPCESFRKVGD